MIHPNQPVTQNGDRPSLELVQVIQELSRQLTAIQDAIRAIPEPTGGSVIDVEARAAINALRAL